MKILKITKGLEVKLDEDDYERISKSQLNYRSDPLRWQATRNNDTNYTWYASKTIDYRKWKLHRYIFHLRGIDIAGLEIDHKDGDGLNNQFSNLRIATSNQNKTSRGVRADSQSGLKGVEFQKQNGNWCAYIVYEGKKRHLGVFGTPEEAALAYNRAAIAHWGEYAWTNKVKKPRL